ncbi:MAG: helix-turn-helix transcriptional regulator [Candidatus Caldatribacteriaceae bacterium]
MYSRKHKGYYFEKSWPFPLFDLTQGEALALFISLSVVEQFRGTPLENFFASLEEKLRIALPEECGLNEKEFTMLFSPFLSPLAIKVDVKETFDIIFQAINQRKRISLRYFSLSSSQETERKVDPYHLYNFEGVWYFCGFCHLRREIRDFALDRVRQVTILPQHFERPHDFSPKVYFAQAFRLYHGKTIRVCVLFDPHKAPLIREQIWHPTQEIEELPDGSLILTVCAHPEEIKHWVLGYGSHARVLEPESFRAAIETEIAKMQEMYREK